MKEESQKLIASKDLQSEGLSSLYRKIDDYIPKAIISKKNNSRSWLYGYDSKYDVVVISKTGQIGDIIESSGLKIALPLKPKECLQRHLLLERR